ncbi:MAG TPA: hypothetical protein VK978_00395 [Candidatus Saccharimonadales bacterium]|nr:hypothetical protein [Candidatus Saccharimonadales bacterium]
MVDRHARTWMCLRSRRHTSRLSDLHTVRIEAKMARTYTDDVDIAHGAVSSPQNWERPGMRDDHTGCALAAMMPTL